MEASINNIKKKPALFILGLPRSGTTLLEQMLDAHSQVTVCPEMYSGMTLWRLNAAKEISDKWKHLLIINYYYQRTNLFEDPINRCLARQAIREFKFPISTNTWYDALIADYLKEKNGTRFGEKTPENTFFVPTLNEAIPESQFIMILRNPFDIVVSLTEAILSPDKSPLPNKWLYHFAVTVKED
ncbi:MAG: sulfotransferase [Saprospiraceae bacterium]|nr:sulfotransferase [Saprospiraceae bacterium]